MISIDKKLINERNIRMFLLLREYNLNEASLKANVTYSYAIKITKEWVELGLLTLTKPEGSRANQIRFTDMGKELAAKLESLYFFCKEKKIM